MANFKEGNTVQLKDKFYDEPSFKKLDRFNRKYISSLAERRLKITHIFISCEEVITVYDGTSNNSAHVPVAILELARPKPQITGAWFDECDDKISTKPVDVCDTCVYKLYIEKKSKQQEEWLSRHSALPDLDFTVAQAAKDAIAARKSMRKWTLEEIMYAKAFLGEFLTSRQLRLSYKNYENSRRGEEIIVTVGDERGTVRCCPTDDWNYYIGTMVAICKATGRPFPSWIQKGNV